MMGALGFAVRKLRYALPALLVGVVSMAGCSGSGDNHDHSGTYYRSAGFHDPYYYGVYDYDDYDPVIVPPNYNTGGKPETPDRPGSGERPGNGLKPSHPIARPPGISNRPSTRPMPSHRAPSIPSRARPSSMGRSGMRGGSMRGGSMRGGGMRGGGGRR